MRAGAVARAVVARAARGGERAARTVAMTMVAMVAMVARAGVVGMQEGAVATKAAMAVVAGVMAAMVEARVRASLSVAGPAGERAARETAMVASLVVDTKVGAAEVVRAALIAEMRNDSRASQRLLDCATNRPRGRMSFRA